jgi:hypothetical protein
MAPFGKVGVVTRSSSYVPRDVNAWSLEFWAHLARFIDGTRHDGLHGEARGQRVRIVASAGDDGSIRIERFQRGAFREAARYPFQLADAPVAVAHVIAKLLRAQPCEVIDVMHLNDFLQTLRRVDNRTSDEDAQKLQRWAERLLPYMELDPTMTVAEALERYHADEEAGHRHPTRPGVPEP